MKKYGFSESSFCFVRFSREIVLLFIFVFLFLSFKYKSLFPFKETCLIFAGLSDNLFLF